MGLGSADTLVPMHIISGQLTNILGFQRGELRSVNDREKTERRLEKDTHGEKRVNWP